MLPLLLLPLTLGNDPEPFRVQNHVPPSFAVTNKVPPVVVKEPTYADILARVRRGEVVEFAAPLAGFPGEPGEYRCWLLDGTPVMQRKGVSLPASPFAGPASPSTPHTTVPFAGGPSTSFPGAAPFRGLTLTPARQVIRGFTNCSPFG